MSPGRDAPLRCETSVPHESMELLGAGVVMVSSSSPSEDLVLTYVGPQHAGNYSCRYRSRWPLVSELSDPVELRVAGGVPLGWEIWIPPPPPAHLGPVGLGSCAAGVGGAPAGAKALGQEQLEHQEGEAWAGVCVGGRVTQLLPSCGAWRRSASPSHHLFLFCPLCLGH